MSSAINPTRRFLRVTTRFAALAFSVSACLLEHLLNAITGKASLAQRPYPLHRWSARFLSWMGVTIECQGTPPERGLIVSNHLSYLDILVFSTVVPCAFVAKKEVKSWPGVGWIATLTGTVYIDRTRRSETHAVQPKMAASLAAGVRLILFPEGTSSDGKQVLPFRSSLFQPAIENHAPITAACISYEMEDGDPAVDVCYYGDMVMGPHAAKLFGKGAIKATVRFGQHAKIFSDRKGAAQAIHEEVTALKGQPATISDGAIAAI